MTQYAFTLYNRPMPNTPSAKTGANIRAEMARSGVSQAALAGRLGLTQSQISKRLSGNVGFTVDELVAVAAALDVPVSVLLPDRAVPA